MPTTLGRLEFRILDALGVPVSGATVQVRKQGAQFASGGPTVLTVDSPGSLTSAPADIVELYDADGVIRDDSTAPTVTGVTATTVTISGAFSVSLADTDRVSANNNLPTIFEDELGNESKTNPLTTNADGLAFCYVASGMFDARSIAGGTTRLFQDVASVGGHTIVTNLFDSATAVGFILNTSRSLSTAGALHTDFQIAGSSIASIDRNGLITCVGLTSSAILTVSGGGAAITGNTTIAGTLGSLTGLTIDSGGATIAGATTITGVLTVAGANPTVMNDELQIVNDRISFGVVVMATADTTPDVGGGTVFTLTNAGPTSITNFDSGASGQLLIIEFADANSTIVDGGLIQLSGGVNFVSTGGDMLSLVRIGSVWFETSRSVN